MASQYQEPFYILSYWRIFLSITAEYKEERYSDSKNCSSKISPPLKNHLSFLLDYWALVVKVKINFHRYISSKMHIFGTYMANYNGSVRPLYHYIERH